MVSRITGSWLEKVVFYDKEYWNIKESHAPQIYPAKESLPSDCRYREDKMWLQLVWDNKNMKNCMKNMRRIGNWHLKRSRDTKEK